MMEPFDYRKNTQPIISHLFQPPLDNKTQNEMTTIDSASVCDAAAIAPIKWVDR
jgi:hypothetical protein